MKPTATVSVHVTRHTKCVVNIRGGHAIVTVVLKIIHQYGQFVVFFNCECVCHVLWSGLRERSSS